MVTPLVRHGTHPLVQGHLRAARSARRLKQWRFAHAGCAAADAFTTQLTFIEDQAEKDAKNDWYIVDSLLFNAFIMCQVCRRMRQPFAYSHAAFMP